MPDGEATITEQANRLVNGSLLVGSPFVQPVGKYPFDFPLGDGLIALFRRIRTGERRLYGLPDPFYLGVTPDDVCVFGYSFGPSTSLVGPVLRWRRNQVSGVRNTRGAVQGASLLVGPDRRRLYIESIRHDEAASRVLDLLVGRAR